jgi:hypothetical protein
MYVKQSTRLALAGVHYVIMLSLLPSSSLGLHHGDNFLSNSYLESLLQVISSQALMGTLMIADTGLAGVGTMYTLPHTREPHYNRSQQGFTHT